MSFSILPDDLPLPLDDGKCDHLTGMKITDNIILYNSYGKEVNLLDICKHSKIVLYIYPMTARPGSDLPAGWDKIPGARGCTPQACSYRDNICKFSNSGFSVYGCSIQSINEQNEAVERLKLPFGFLSDTEFSLKRALNLPTFKIGGIEYYKRVTLIIVNGVIMKYFYPVFPPNKDIINVLNWITDSY